MNSENNINSNNQNEHMGQGQGQRMNNNGLRNSSPMEQARQNSQRAFNSNPYIQNQSNQSFDQNMGENPYYNNMNSMNNNTNNNMPNQTQQEPSIMNSLYGDFDTSNFIKGALLGAVGAYLLTNENAQKTIFKGVAKGSEMFQAGIEEMKERFEDAKAEMDAEK